MVVLNWWTPDLAGTDADQRICLLRSIDLRVTADQSDSIGEAALLRKLTAVRDGLTVHVYPESSGIRGCSDDAQEKFAPAAAEVQHHALQFTRKKPDDGVGSLL